MVCVLAFGDSAMTMPQNARFRIGETVVHKDYGIRAVVVDADARFSLTDDWYEEMTENQPPKDKPWYRVLLDGTEYAAYVPELNLQADGKGDPIDHPEIRAYLREERKGVYAPLRRFN